MIETIKTYKIALTENQVRQLYTLLQSAKQQDQLSYGSQYDDLRELHSQLKELFDAKGVFDAGIR